MRNDFRRIKDVQNMSGQRLGSMQLENYFSTKAVAYCDSDGCWRDNKRKARDKLSMIGRTKFEAAKRGDVQCPKCKSMLIWGRE